MKFLLSFLIAFVAIASAQKGCTEDGFCGYAGTTNGTTATQAPITVTVNDGVTTCAVDDTEATPYNTFDFDVAEGATFRTIIANFEAQWKDNAVLAVYDGKGFSDAAPCDNVALLYKRIRSDVPAVYKFSDLAVGTYTVVISGGGVSTDGSADPGVEGNVGIYAINVIPAIAEGTFANTTRWRIPYINGADECDFSTGSTSTLAAQVWTYTPTAEEAGVIDVTVHTIPGTPADYDGTVVAVYGATVPAIVNGTIEDPCNGTLLYTSEFNFDNEYAVATFNATAGVTYTVIFSGQDDNDWVNTKFGVNVRPTILRWAGQGTGSGPVYYTQGVSTNDDCDTAQGGTGYFDAYHFTPEYDTYVIDSTSAGSFGDTQAALLEGVYPGEGEQDLPACTSPDEEWFIQCGDTEDGGAIAVAGLETDQEYTYATFERGGGGEAGEVRENAFYLWALTGVNLNLNPQTSSTPASTLVASVAVLVASVFVALF